MHKEIKERIPALIEISGYRNNFVAKKIGMSPAYFSVKKRKGNWSEKEVEIFWICLQAKMMKYLFY